MRSSMKERRQGLPESAFSYLPITEHEIARIPETLRQVFQPYLQIIQTRGGFLAEGARTVSVGDIVYNVRKYRIGDRDAFAFYSEFSDAQGVQERKTVELKTDRNYVGIETAEVISHKVDETGERILSKIWTRIDLSRGTYVEQQVEPIPMELQDKSYSKQTFTLNTRDLTLARLTWSKNGEEHPVVEITPTGETIFLHSEQIRTDYRTGERLIKGPEGTIRLPRPDEFVEQAIKKVVNLEPITFPLQ